MEREVKITLDREDDMEKLIQKLGGGEEQTQVNTYYTTEKASREKTAIRVRKISTGKCYLIIKGKAEVQDGYFQCAETSYTVKDDADFLAHYKEYLKDESETPHVLVEFKTVRTVVQHGPFTLELDRVTSKNLSFAEIECETTEPEAYKVEIARLLAELGIKWSYSQASKLYRVLGK